MRHWLTCIVLAAMAFGCDQVASTSQLNHISDSLLSDSLSRAASSAHLATDAAENSASPFTCEELRLQDRLVEYLLGIQSEEGQEFTYLANMGAYEKSLILFKGPFTQRGHQQTLATIELRLGGSAGSYDRLYVLFDCPQQPEFICSAFSGQPQGQPLDLNGDGLLELVTEAGQTWMGECHDELEVITWKGGKAEVIYETFSGQHVNCGGIWAVDNTNIGDTIGTHYRSQFSDEDQDGVFEILQIREVMLSQGGATEEEMGQLAEVVVDSLVLSWQRDGWR